MVGEGEAEGEGDDAAGLGEGLAERATDGGALTAWAGAPLSVPLDAVGPPDLELPPVSA
jgi:hypothetical protein